MRLIVTRTPYIRSPCAQVTAPPAPRARRLSRISGTDGRFGPEERPLLRCVKTAPSPETGPSNAALPHAGPPVELLALQCAIAHPVGKNLTYWPEAPMCEPFRLLTVHGRIPIGNTTPMVVPLYGEPCRWGGTADARTPALRPSSTAIRNTLWRLRADGTVPHPEHGRGGHPLRR